MLKLSLSQTNASKKLKTFFFFSLTTRTLHAIVKRCGITLTLEKIGIKWKCETFKFSSFEFIFY